MILQLRRIAALKNLSPITRAKFCLSSTRRASAVSLRNLKVCNAYKDKGLEILGFPCNQFAAQDPGSNEEIQTFCKLNYGVKFQIFEKGDVRGANAQPLFKYLVAQKKFTGFDESSPMTAILMDALQKNFPEYLEGDDIKWNFTKFLIDKNGEVVARFEPMITPESIAKDIEALL